jgi:hypothetical protein
MRDCDETYDVIDELDHYKHVSAIRASKIARLRKQLKDAEKVILTCDTIFKSGIDKQKAINEYFEKYVTDM